MDVSLPRQLFMLWGLSALSGGVQAIPLLNGRFDTSTDVQGLLNLALDAAEMRESEIKADRLAIYTDGKYATQGTTTE
jgi:hypothetical protein